MSLQKYVYSCKPIRAVDGDTVEVDVDLGWEIFHRLHIRMLGVNAPEKHTPNGPTATKYFTDMLAGIKTFIMRSDLYDKYGRTVGVLWDASIHDPGINDSINTKLEKYYQDTGIAKKFVAPVKP